MKHNVWTAGYDIEIKDLTFDGGAGFRYQTTSGISSLGTLTVSGSVAFFGYKGMGAIRTDGVKVDAAPGLYCSAVGIGDVPGVSSITQGADVIMNDPGYISAGATLQDIQPEGCAQAYTRKVSNRVRSTTVSVMIRATALQYIGRLLRMAESPYPVLLVTDTYMMKGYIESAVTDASSVGKEFVTYKVTVAEAL